MIIKMLKLNGHVIKFIPDDMRQKSIYYIPAII